VIAALGGIIVGAASTLVAPLWLRGKRLQALTREPPCPLNVNVSERAEEIRLAHRSSNRLLATLPRPLWRNSCLYRSIAHCLALRWYGLPAIVVVGVRRGGKNVQAHAWVAVRGVPYPARPAHRAHPGDCESVGTFQPLVAANPRSRR
jgi:hypothetical protein